MNRSRWTGAAATVALVASIVWGWQILSSSAQARTADGLEGCGSVVRVVVAGDAYRGGELRPDQQAFDAACVSDAHDHVRTAVVPALLALAAVVVLLPSLRAEHRRARSDRGRRTSARTTEVSHGPPRRAPHHHGDSVDG